MLQVLKDILLVRSACYNFIRSTCVSVRQANSDVILNESDYERPSLCFWLLVPGVLGLGGVKRALTDPGGASGLMPVVFGFTAIALGTLVGESLYHWLADVTRRVADARRRARRP